MKQKALAKILKEHKLWFSSEGGKRADLRGAYLQDANLRGADLQDANLQDANLREADLRGAYLQDANLRGADLRGAYLQDANLREADLREADLRGADLRGADLHGSDLQGTNFDFSVLNLSCYGINLDFDNRVKAQIMYHAINLCGAKYFKNSAVKLANESHIVTKHGLPKLGE